MKRVFIAFCWLILSGNVFCQVQRLALLPQSMRLGEDFAASLCIDFFKVPPGMEGTATSYRNFQTLDGNVANIGRNSVDADDFRKLRMPSNNRETVLLLPDGSSGAVSARYKDFLTQRINYYKNAGSFTESKLNKLQAEIWAYDILDHLNYINHNEATMDGYTRAMRKLGREFYGDENISGEDVVAIGEELSFFKEPQSNRAAIKIFRNPENNRYIVFNKISSPIYSGFDVTEMAAQIAPRVSDGAIIAVDPVENAARDRAFIKDLQRKMRLTHSKQVSVATTTDAYLWTARNHTITEAFNANNIRQVQQGESTAYRASMTMETEDLLLDYSTEIEGTSNNRNLLSRFFTSFTSNIRSLQEQFVLGRLTRQIRTQVIRDMQLPATDYLDVMMITEGEAKTLIKIRKGKIEIIEEYASR